MTPWLALTSTKEAKATSDSHCVISIQCVCYCFIYLLKKSNGVVQCFVELLLGAVIYRASWVSFFFLFFVNCIYFNKFRSELLLITFSKSSSSYIQPGVLPEDLDYNAQLWNPCFLWGGKPQWLEVVGRFVCAAQEQWQARWSTCWYPAGHEKQANAKAKTVRTS